MFIALTVSEGLPQEIRAWLAAVLTKNFKPEFALVALLGTTASRPPEMHPLDNYLHELARSAGIECFIHWHRQKPAWETGSLTDYGHISASATAFSSMMANQVGEPRWGLNE